MSQKFTQSLGAVISGRTDISKLTPVGTFRVFLNASNFIDLDEVHILRHIPVLLYDELYFRNLV
jgi:hypothetical protein